MFILPSLRPAAYYLPVLQQLLEAATSKLFEALPSGLTIAIIATRRQ